ncbi:hypothetical protein J2D69_14795 [Lysinibacillus sphaericus]|uniref:Rad50/SbcC-type AAA domain-containing protein n=3 Tax=Lysinibacillus TaxID=400634 RepID=B1HRZ1_LYSSC|nr:MULTISPECIES: ATP-binding protein [Lysinibacillus]MBE5084191.1 hypothetical protein [Bacillus thuringiensis]ACA41014.1 conserved hypothetical protein [Lysinibacillus sphaericus C3-41]AMO33048.1 hypothetical protein AR327_11655 [Lysinibacillus sphaericus]AMR91847.1 hypothetical protein A1T07_17555 [Lysinibacillus sphaericus]ANA45895.1 hypothetical protein A2J09_10220 [Lysinibacillus sphaericus]
MGTLVINSLKYSADTYFYKNEKFTKGINLIVGDNGNGKSTFTYLIVYCLGINVEFVKDTSKEPIKVILNDTNKHIELKISLNNENFTLRRQIGENVVSVYDETIKEYTTYSVYRNGYIYQKEEMTISDWLMGKLGIEFIEVAQNNTTHRLNIDDLFRYIYHDQLTENKKIISEFGLQSYDYFKNSNIMKRSIFEVLMSGYNEEYYKKYAELKLLTKDLQVEKQKLKSIEIIQEEILKQLRKHSMENINSELITTQKELKRLNNIREDIKKEQHFGEEVASRIEEIQKNIVIETHKLKNYEYRLSSVSEGLSKSIRVKDDLNNEIEHIDKVLFTAQFIDIINNEECPFCLEKINLEDDKCICGSNNHLDFSRFIYSDKEYIKLLKSKVKSLETINEVIEGYKKDYKHLNEIIVNTKKQINTQVNEIKLITSDMKVNSNTFAIEEITNKIIPLKETASELEILKEKAKDINSSKSIISGLEDRVRKTRERLNQLEEEKDNLFQKNIEKFEEIYSEYLRDFFDANENEYIVKLDRNYYPIIGEYKEQSFNVPRRLFFYLSMLKLSLNPDYQIAFPRFLIIDTLKAEGIEVPHLKKLFTYIEEFKDKDCQIIITSGYDEYEAELQKDYLIEYLSSENKLLKRRRKIKRVGS